MDSSLNFQFHFFPVGQGLFSCGVLSRDNSSTSQFTWVYDCGTTSSQKLIDRSIAVLEKLIGHSKQIDLLVLSHFDRDHISGVTKLLGRFKVGTLLLPYMYLPQSIAVGFDEGLAADDELMGFFINPVLYLTSIEGAQIEQIAFVRPSDGDGPPPSEGSPNEPNPSDGRIQLEISETQEISRVDLRRFDSAYKAIGKKTRVVLVPPGAVVKCSRLWEFVPYNDDSHKKIPVEFGKLVDDSCEVLLNAGNFGARERALEELKTIYDRTFGRSPIGRNMISLSLYTGPIYASYSESCIGAFSSAMVCGCYISRVCNEGGVLKTRCSLIYTGDAYFETPEKLGRFADYLGESRVSRVGIFQVMHHGAEGNWHPGVADSIHPLISVFSSDPQHKAFGHPHGSVLRDFWPYSPIQVDKVHEFLAHGFLV